MKIALATTIVPNDLRTGSEIATLALVQTLQGLGHDVTVYAYGRPFIQLEAAVPTVLLATIPITTADAPLAHKLRWLGRSLASGLPISSEKFNYASPDRLAAAILKAGAELLIVDHVNLYPFWRASKTRLPVGVVFHDIQAVSYAMVAAGARSPWWRAVYGREARLNARLEQEAGRAAAFSLFLSDGDAATAESRFATPRAAVVPLFYPFAERLPEATDAAYDVGLIGTWSWPPVASGMRWFLDRVMPHLPVDVTVAVAGHGSEALEGARIVKLGVVPDARRFLDGCRVSAVPTTAGTGLQIKTLELAASGMPAVATALGVRGFDDLPATIRIADDPAAFAAALTEVVARRRAEGRHGPEPVSGWNADRRRRAKAVMRGALEAAERR